MRDSKVLQDTKCVIQQTNPATDIRLIEGAG